MSQLFHNFCLIAFKHIGTSKEVHIILTEIHYFINMSNYKKRSPNFSYLNFDTLSSIDVQIVAYQ